MTDISMCKNKTCTKSSSCYRFTATPNEYRQSYILWKEKWTKWCDMFMDNNNK